MLLHPTLAAREPVPGEEQGTHLEPCAFCATANGATALTCWRCGAQLQHGRLDELVSKRNEPVAPAAALPEARPTAMPPAGVPIPTLYPSFNAYDPNATVPVPVPITVALGLLRQPSEAPEEQPVLDMATLLGTAALGGRQLADPQASAPEEPKPGTDLVVAATPIPFTRKQRALMAGGLVAISVLAVFAGSSLLDHYQTARVGAGWSTSARLEPADTVAGKAADNKLGEDPVETLRRQPTQAGPGGVEAVSAMSTAAPAAALVPLATPANALATAVSATSSPPTPAAATANPAVLDSGAVAALGPGTTAATTSGTTTSTTASTTTGMTTSPPTGPTRSTTAITTAAAPVVASDTTVRRRNPSRSGAARYAAVRRDAAEARDPAADRVEPAAPRPCTAGVAALGLCTP